MRSDEGFPQPPTMLCRVLRVLFLSFASFLVVAQAQNCASTTPLPLTVTNAVKVDNCQDVWTAQNFTLRFKQDSTAKTLSIVLSVPKGNRWYGIGFNKNLNQMVDSSALVGWVDPASGATNITPYFLGAQLSSEVRPDYTRLSFMSPGPKLISAQDTLYLTFEIDQAKSTASFDNQILAIGHAGDIPNSDGTFNQHEYETYFSINFQSGIVSSEQDGSSSLPGVHAAVNIIGWGVLLPVGAIIARFAKGFDPTWFYTHAISQTIGFMFAIAGLVTGFRLIDQFPGVDANHHRNLGIGVLVLAVWQVSALLIRPGKDAKVRRYWNWGHWWVGRIGLLLAAINVFIGINIAQGSKKLKAGYAIIIALELLVAFVLESFRWIKYFRRQDAPPLPQVSMQNRSSSYEPSFLPQDPMPVYGSGPRDTRPLYGSAYESSNWNDAKY